MRLSLLFLLGLLATPALAAAQAPALRFAHVSDHPAAAGGQRPSPRLDARPGLRLDGPRRTAGLAPATPATLARRHTVDCGCPLPVVHLFRTEVALRADRDGDGFYHAFDLTLDVDTDSGEAWVYAVLSVSYQGGPWNVLHTTGDFHLIGHRADDAYVVEVNLDSGYPSGDYDLLVELYDADSGAWLAGWGPAERSALAALPLEDAGRDPLPATRVDYVVEGGGALGWWLWALLGLGGLRHKRQRGPRPPLVSG